MSEVCVCVFDSVCVYPGMCLTAVCVCVCLTEVTRSLLPLHAANAKQLPLPTCLLTAADTAHLCHLSSFTAAERVRGRRQEKRLQHSERASE